MKSIIFNQDMARSWYAGQKTRTMRIMNPQPHAGIRKSPIAKSGLEDGHGLELRPNYYPGEIVYVRETWADNVPGCVNGLSYRADHRDPTGDGPANPMKWKPSIHMPEWAARSHARITSVKAQRVQDVTEDEARAEGVTDGGCLNCGHSEPCGCNNPQPDARDAFAWLIDSIYPGSWCRNDWCWAYDLEKV